MRTLTWTTLRPGAAALLVLSCIAVAGPPPATAAPPQFGDIDTLAGLPAIPGFPEGISVHGNRVFVSGPAIAGTAGTGPSKVYVLGRNTGEIETELTVTGENLGFDHALSCNAVDGDGRLYVLTAQLFAPPAAQLGILRFTRHGQSYVQESYSHPFPNLPSCQFGPIPVSCALPNDLAFADDGTLYVTDSLQAAIWRVPPGGGEPQVWLQTPLFSGSGPLPIGVNGIRLDPGRQWVYVTVTFSSADFTVGAVYRIPFVAHPDELSIQLVHEYTGGEAPDGIAFGASGRLYVALAGSNQISVLAPDGSEITRIGSAPGDGIPLDGPANIAFDPTRKSLLITNHASLSGNQDNFAVLRAFVGDIADPLALPALP